jgi:GcrA cell cycle regulator
VSRFSVSLRGWSPPAEAWLAEHWLTQSGEALGEVLGCSSSAAIGKAHRLKLPRKPSPIRNTSETRTASTAERKVVVKPAAQQRRTEAGYNPMQLAMQTGCCWPHGDPGTASFRFCGDGTPIGSPYCAAHRKIAYTRIGHK